ncbi:MAG TPA: hypothetical protein VLT90_00115 [Terriglobales bacterium]|nr:hypothetical protein [Terriglobales bacterium]
MTRNVKRYGWIFSAVAVLTFAILAAYHSGAQVGAAANGGVASPDVTLAAATRGVVFDTAAINADGSIAACFGCTGAIHLSTGTYEVDFGTNVQATNGWSRWVQPDTLTTGSEAVFCDTADRAGNANGIFVNCQNAAGTFTDGAFFLFVAR